MTRLTITLPKPVYNRLSSIAIQSNDSISGVINRLIGIGIHYMDEHQSKQDKADSQVEQHCHHLIIQMNALIKNMSAEILKFNQEDFEQLRQATLVKYSELVKASG